MVKEISKIYPTFSKANFQQNGKLILWGKGKLVVKMIFFMLLEIVGKQSIIPEKLIFLG